MIAALLGSREPDLVAQRVEQGGTRVEVQAVSAAIDLEFDGDAAARRRSPALPPVFAGDRIEEGNSCGRSTGFQHATSAYAASRLLRHVVSLRLKAGECCSMASRTRQDEIGSPCR